MITDTTQLHGSILGNRVLRTEDPRLLTGAATYLADLELDRPLHAVFVRSDIAHGVINSVDVVAAHEMPGIVTIWTALELDVKPHHGFVAVHKDFARPPLATDRVRFVGEAIAVVFAETQSQGVDAAAQVFADIDPIPAVVAIFEQSDATYPFGAHIAVVEVDTETGRARLIRHVAVDDCGTVINPLLVEGQQHGGIASGIGQALYEEVRFDADGNPITSNFADYGLPSAAEMPSFETMSIETPTPLNPLGAKGIGEAATIGSTPAIQNAVIDAVSHLGVRHIDMPCTAERVWTAIQSAQRGDNDPWREPPAIFATLQKGVTGDAEAASAADGI